MMIPHHRQAVQMSDIILAKGGIRPDVRSLAEQIKGAQQPEIDQMTSWLQAWGAPTEMHHGSGETMMDGMLSEQQIRELEAADAKQGQKRYLEGMIEHHQGAVEMARKAQPTSQSPDVKQLTQSIIDSQNAEIEQMRGILKQL